MNTPTTTYESILYVLKYSKRNMSSKEIVATIKMLGLHIGNDQRINGISGRLSELTDKGLVTRTKISNKYYYHPIHPINSSN